MKIETIEETGRSGRLRLRFDDGRTLLAPPAVIAGHGLYAGMELPEGAFPALQESCAAASARERALRIISAAPISRRALKERLVQKGETEEDAQAAVDWLTELRLLDDRQVAEQIVRSGLSRGYGPARIRQMLYEKRIPKQLWDQVLAELPAQDDAIDDFLRRRFRGSTPDPKEIKRATDALLRRGHAWSDIRRALSRYTAEDQFLYE